MYNTNTGITLMNSVDMLSETSTLASVGAMLYVSVPAITWLMITGSGQMLGNVMSGVSTSFGSQLAKDQSGVEQAKDLQRQKINQERAKNSEGREAALSYGELMFFENLQKAHQDTGTFMSNKSFQDNGGDLSSKSNIKNTAEIFDTLSKDKELKTLGITNEKGVNYDKLKELSQKRGDTAAVDAVRTMEKYDFDGDRIVSNEEIQKAMHQGTKAEQLKTQEELSTAMKTIQQIGNGDITTAADKKSTTAVNDQDIKQQVQKKVIEGAGGLSNIVNSESFKGISDAIANDYLAKNISPNSYGENKAKTDLANNKSVENISQKTLNAAKEIQAAIDTGKYANSGLSKKEQVDAAIRDYKVNVDTTNEEAKTISIPDKVNSNVFDTVKKVFSNKGDLGKLKELGQEWSKDNDPEVKKLMENANLNGAKTDEEKAIFALASLNTANSGYSSVVSNKINEMAKAKGINSSKAGTIDGNKNIVTKKSEEAIQKNTNEDQRIIFNSSKEIGQIVETNKKLETYKDTFLANAEKNLQTHWTTQKGLINGNPILSNQDKLDAKMINGNILVSNLAKEGFYSETVSKEVYDVSKEALLKSKNSRIANLDEIKDKDKIEEINKTYNKSIDTLNKNFVNSGAATIDKNNKMIFNDTIESLNTLDHNSTEYSSKLTSIKGKFDGNNIKGISDTGYNAEFTVNSHNGNLTTASFSASVGMQLKGSDMDASFMVGNLTNKSETQLMGVAVASGVISTASNLVGMPSKFTKPFQEKRKK